MVLRETGVSVGRATQWSPLQGTGNAEVSGGYRFFQAGNESANEKQHAFYRGRPRKRQTRGKENAQKPRASGAEAEIACGSEA